MKVRLSDICQGYVKNIALKDLSDNNGSYPIYGASGYIKDVDFYVSDCDYLGIVKDGAGVGRVDKYPAYSSLLGTMQYIIPNNDVDINYLKYLLISLHLENGVSGAAIPHIYYKNYKNTNVNICPIEEQKEIACYLDSVNNAISLAKKRLLALDELVKSRFIEMFGEPSSNPYGWRKCKIQEVARCIAGATPSTAIKDYWENGTIPWMSSGEVNNGRVYETEKKITELGYKNASTKLIPPHTVVLAMAGQGKTRGTVAVAEIELCTNQSLCSIVTNDEVNTDYLYYYLQTQYEELRESSNGDGGRGGLNLKIIGAYPLILPPISLQNEFAEFVKLIDKSKFIVQQQIKDLEELLDSKMDEYFR